VIFRSIYRRCEVLRLLERHLNIRTGLKIQMNDNLPTAVAVDLEDIDIGIESTIVDAAPLEPVVRNEVLICYSLSRTVRCFSVIDFVFSMVYAFYNTYFSIPAFFAIAGYFGAKYYHRCWVCVYLSSVIAVNIFRVSFFIDKYVTSEESNAYVGDVIWVALCAVIELWVAKIVFSFYRSMGRLTIEELSDLRMVGRIGGYRVVLW